MEAVQLEIAQHAYMDEDSFEYLPDRAEKLQRVIRRLLEAALALASHRVVVKRPRKAPIIDGPKPGYSLEGKSSRYDIYALKKLG